VREKKKNQSFWLGEDQKSCWPPASLRCGRAEASNSEVNAANLTKFARPTSTSSSRSEELSFPSLARGAMESQHGNVQAPREVIMVRPKHFGYDAETAVSNAFQHKPSVSAVEVERLAVEEFDEAVKRLRTAGVAVRVFEDRASPVCPDAVFPNNWFSAQVSADGRRLAIVYPMHCPGRRAEKRQDVLDYLTEECRAELLDFSGRAEKGVSLEGTGAIVFDHVNRVAFACRSPRSDEKLLNELCEVLGYEPCWFRSVDQHGQDIYHTNVMMWVGTKAAGVCYESIPSTEEMLAVHVALTRSPANREVVKLSHSEITGMAGNCLEVRNDSGELLLAMSQTASDSLTKDTRRKLEGVYDGGLVVCPIANIENVGGGSLRCMMAGNHLV